MNALTSLFIFIVRSLALAQGPQLAWQRSHGSRWGAANGWSVGIRYISLWESNLVCWTCLYGTYPTISSPHYIRIDQIMLQEKGLAWDTKLENWELKLGFSTLDRIELIKLFIPGRTGSSSTIMMLGG